MLIELIAVMVIIGLLSGLGIPRFSKLIEGARVVRAIGDLRTIAQALVTIDSLPASLADIGFGNRRDPWGNPYVYLPFPPGLGRAPPAGARKDRFLVPINSRYDLYSVGRDGASMPPLTASPSRDDVVVANDGGYIGLASKY